MLRFIEQREVVRLSRFYNNPEFPTSRLSLDKTSIYIYTETNKRKTDVILSAPS